MPRVLIVRGRLVTPWELRPWTELPERFDVSYLLTRSNEFDASSLPLRAEPVTSLRDRLPRGVLGEVAAGVAGERYLADAEPAYAAADIVHAEELSFWFSADAARRKERHGYRLVQTVWETLPFLRSFRNRHARRYRDEVLAATDLFLPATERARMALLLEGVPEERISVCFPGIDVERFSAASPAAASGEHVVLSPGRLVWEKGHQDVLRAVALLARDGVHARVRIVGRGPEEGRLREYAEELGIAGRVEIGAVSYEEMPQVFASASCMVLASLPSAGAQLHPFDVPRAFWEEQFGMVLAEAMAAGLDILAAENGAIPEVLDGAGTLFAPGDWPTLARLLAEGPLATSGRGAGGVSPRARAALLDRCHGGAAGGGVRPAELAAHRVELDIRGEAPQDRHVREQAIERPDRPRQPGGERVVEGQGQHVREPHVEHLEARRSRCLARLAPAPEGVVLELAVVVEAQALGQPFQITPAVRKLRYVQPTAGAQHPVKLGE